MRKLSDLALFNLEKRQCLSHYWLDKDLQNIFIGVWTNPFFKMESYLKLKRLSL